MVDRILDFLKNKYFIGAVVAIFLGILINSVVSYMQGKANEEEFKKFQEINNSLSSENSINLEDIDFEFDSIGFEIITKSVFAKKALDERNFSEAFMLFEDVFFKIKDSSISKDTKEVLLEQYYENLIRLSMELDDFNKGDSLIKENKIETVRYHDVAGDFYKHFQENELAIYHYDQAMLFDIDESQKNLIKLKKPII
jgi:predicted negative regulator of RcsB-dependent stress response|tara:strand:- start:1243 stop:1836 length:594 start_codon:yes stop_codon:yes gene_type:complete